ncbi:type III-B CRISPR module RAMP protein Cmr4 [Brunnivagina elsteri]|uniref:Type III-B CRISPR module RAMP protein Cmr4 n=1 Tax=Brunnivagina elsteri CCALA 953 TaxID=987040 RepID=A0A2A2TEJ0_9CYAN|nr:type III-B CRISPR module RAMP protein Cmr4 [Calothrix elsteri]PAX52133.1 type III-B CRISPR module RAMP protein Cmr4 [Calothrix elsteri CCALA 953]
MYKKAYGIIETLAPLHVGATAGEESGNLNLIFRDQFTQTGIIPGSSLRGRFRAEMRNYADEKEVSYWYGAGADSEQSDTNNESITKFEHASIIWLPVFCPGQPIVWVSSRRLLERYKRIAGIKAETPDIYVASSNIKARESRGKKTLFFNLGFLEISRTEDLSQWFPNGKELPAVIVDDSDIAMIHDMALYRQSRVRLKNDEKVVDGGGFFNTEALPEATILVFPIALRDDKSNKKWEPFPDNITSDIYFGGLESIGFGHCKLKIVNP